MKQPHRDGGKPFKFSFKRKYRAELARMDE